MLERINPLLRVVCLALTGLIVFQISQIAVKRPVGESYTGKDIQLSNIPITAAPF